MPEPPSPTVDLSAYCAAKAERDKAMLARALAAAEHIQANLRGHQRRQRPWWRRWLP